jgi:hypothetical protein
MLITALALLLPLSNPTGAPIEGAAQRDLIEKMVKSDVSTLVVEEASSTAVVQKAILAAESSEEIGFFDKYFPFGLDEELHPDVDKNVVVIWLLMAFFGTYAGPLWIPKVLTGLDTDEEYTTEALINWLVHMAMVVVSVPFVYCIGLGIVFILVNEFYLFPVATINSFNRHVDDGGGKKKKRGGASAFNELPGLPTLARSEAMPSLAY